MKLQPLFCSLMLCASPLLAACDAEDEQERKESQEPAVPNEPQVPAELPEGTEAYLDFWWSKGTTSKRHHLTVMRAKANAEETEIAYASFDIPESQQGWRELFRRPSSKTTGVYTYLSLSNGNPAFEGARDEMKRRVNEELGGLAKHQLVVHESLALGERKAAIVIVGSVLVAFPEEMEQARRDEVLYAVLFSHSAARAAEDKSGQADAYREQFKDVLVNTGWSGSTQALSLDTNSLLIENLGTLSKATSFFEALGLMQPEASRQ